jgi:hypothetical protein
VSWDIDANQYVLLPIVAPFCAIIAKSKHFTGILVKTYVPEES